MSNLRNAKREHITDRQTDETIQTRNENKIRKNTNKKKSTHEPCAINPSQEKVASARPDTVSIMRAYIWSPCDPTVGVVPYFFSSSHEEVKTKISPET